jgi:hypothetical protein
MISFDQHMFLLTERGLRSYIDLDPSKATRATVFHEWLHRYFGRRGIQFDTVDAEHAAIEAFLKRHKILLGID